MDAETIRNKAQSGTLTKSVAGQKPVYAVVTNSTYDGLCYKAVRAEALLEQSSDRIHFDEAWYGYARFNPMYRDHFAMRGDPGTAPGGRPSLRLIPPTSCSRHGGIGPRATFFLR
jgi:arginine decarboxylase